MARAGDGEGTFGGNGSVDWKVRSLNVRARRVKSKNVTKNKEFAEKGDQNDEWECEGVDETPDIPTEPPAPGDGRPSFTISIFLPNANREAFLDSIRTAPTNGNWVVITLPILRNTPEQIKVTWPSRPR
jgi:hypothetical protein